MRRAGLVVLTFVLVACSARRTGDNVPHGPLPPTVRPTHYDLRLSIDPSEARFSGEASIRVDLREGTRAIWLHGEGLEPTSVSVTAEATTQPATWVAKAEGIAQIRFDERVGPGEATLDIAYTAPFDERLRGLYRIEVDGAWYAFTQFEPLDARQAFPSFDEPAFKTPFDITIVVPSGSTAITNTPELESEKRRDGTVRKRFRTTVPLPTYLIAFAVGPFDVVDGPPLTPRGPRKHAVPLRGVAARGRGEELGYALEHTPALLYAFEDWFGSPFPYEKLDIIAVPDFASGAMENAGAITFRDSLLLFDGSMSTRNRRLYTYVMAHELAHTWFGNTVTMPWWDDIWLNEAFATWHGNRIVSTVAPEQRAEVSMLGGVHRAMGIDGRASARAIRQPIESNHDVHNAFDPITYSKGAGVLAMFERWMGPDAFRRGVRQYIEAHRDGNATTADLLAALSNASGRDVSEPFESFLTQPGVPLVTARTVCTDREARIELEQERYVPLGSEAPRDAEWKIPVCVRVGLLGAGAPTDEICGLLDDTEGSLAVPGGACPTWLMPNAGAAGYYRFSLSPEDTKRLMTAGFDALSPIERISVAANLDASFRAGAEPAAVFGSFPVLASDPDRATAEAPTGLLWLANEHLIDDAHRPALQAYTAELYGARLSKLGWEPSAAEDGETALLRRAVVDALATLARDPAVRAELLRRARRYAGLDGKAADGEALAPDLVDVGLRVAIEEGGEPVFIELEKQVHESQNALERAHRLRALGAATEPALIARAQALSLDERLRVNEATQTLWPLMMREATQEETCAFVEANFDALVARTGPGGAGKLPWLVSGLCDPTRIDRAEEFLTPRAATLQGGPRNLASAVEAARQCAALKAAQSDGVAQFLSETAVR